jgi:hypothetical protein
MGRFWIQLSGLDWLDIAINVVALAVIPGLLAAYGGHLAAQAIKNKKHSRKVKTYFWMLFSFGIVVTLWQQIRIAELSAMPDIGMEFVSPNDVSFRMVNLSNSLLRDPKYGFALVDLDGPRTVGSGDSAIPQILPIPAATNFGDFLRARQKYIQRPIVTTFPAVKAIVKPNDRIFGFVSVSCPNCIKERKYWLYFVNGIGGWYCEIPDESPAGLPIQGMLRDPDSVLASIAPPNKRITIGNP